MNDVIKCIQQGIINYDYLDMYCPCHIYGIWRSKEVGDTLKSSFRNANQFNTAVLKPYCKSYRVL